MIIGFPPHHARVTVAEDMQLLDLQMFARTLGFRGAYVSKFWLHLVRIHVRVHHFALFPAWR